MMPRARTSRTTVTKMKMSGGAPGRRRARWLTHARKARSGKRPIVSDRKNSLGLRPDISDALRRVHANAAPCAPRRALLAARGHRRSAPPTRSFPTAASSSSSTTAGHSGVTTARARRVKQPASLLVGQMIEPVVLAPDGPVGVAAIRLRPAASRTLLGFSLSGSLGAVRRPRADLSVGEAGCASAWRTQRRTSSGSRALEAWLIRMACPPPRRHIEALVGRIVQSGGRASIDSLVASDGHQPAPAGAPVSGGRRAHAEDVLPDRPAAGGARAASGEGLPLTEVALACGFYDQAHMTRDFRELASMSPGVWQNHAGDLAAARVVTPS